MPPREANGAKKGYDPPVVEPLEFGLRPGRRDDFLFAEGIYIDSMRPLMVALGSWNEAERRAALRRSYKTAEITVITLDGADIGWMQVSERDTDYNLAQIQLLEEHCGNGIGTRLIGHLLERAGRDGKTVSLSAVRTNRAIRLYERLGFRTIDPDATPIIDMVWKAEAPSAGVPA
jgi:GNAT superfamily N-acetyltransferase